MYFYVTHILLYATRVCGNVPKQINIFPVRMWFILLSALSVVWIIKIFVKIHVI